jgi:hypothetical protein
VLALKDAETQTLTKGKLGSSVPMGNDLQGKTTSSKSPFFTKIKELTVLGYYTSEVGAQQELSYNPMPMRYEGDYDFVKVGKQWSW